MTDKPKTTGKRVYVVLERYKVETDDDWHFVGRQYASSESAAKRQAIQGIGAEREYGELVAVPERYWKPTTPTVTAQTVLKIEGV